ncbi:MAG: hypothetical protein R2854_20165 [Caldilineaceae bacterium]
MPAVDEAAVIVQAAHGIDHTSFDFAAAATGRDLAIVIGVTVDGLERERGFRVQLALDKLVTCPILTHDALDALFGQLLAPELAVFAAVPLTKS